MSTTLRLTIDEFDDMIARGAFDALGDRRIELIRGELREMSPPKPPREDVVDFFTEWSITNLPRGRVRVRIQNSIGIPPLESVPLPDVAWVARQSYRTRRPQIPDVLLVIEVADSTLRYDRRDKAALYAEAGVREYWVVNISQSCIEVFREPEGSAYRSHEVVRAGGSVSPLAFPEIALPVSLIFAA